MGRRVSSIGLAVLVVAVTALGIAAFTVPIRVCRTCEGLAIHLYALTSPSLPPIPPPNIGCPDCGDRGKVSIAKFWRGSLIDPALSRILQSRPQGTSRVLMKEVNDLARRSGKLGYEFTGDLRFEEPFGWMPRFVRSEGQDYLILSLYSPGMMIPSTSYVGLILMSLDGRALDYVQFACSNRIGQLSHGFVKPPGSDGTLVQITADGGMLIKGADPTLGYQLYQGGRSRREGVIDRRGSSGLDVVCRIGVDGESLVVLTPADPPPK